MVNCEVEVPYETSSAKSASRARSARSCVVMDLVVTEQMEDPHVVYAVGDADVDNEVGQEVVVRDNSSKGLVMLGWTV